MHRQPVGVMPGITIVDIDLAEVWGGL